MSDKRSSFVTSSIIAGVGVGLIGVLATLAVKAANEYENDRRRQLSAQANSIRSIRSTDHEGLAAIEETRTDLNNTANTNQNTNHEIPVASTTRRTNYSPAHFCNSQHTGRKLVDEILPIHLDELFNLLFSKSEFLVDFHRKQKLTDISYGNWEEKGNGQKERVISYKSSSGYGTVTARETDRMNRFSESEEHYSIDASVNASGVLYADTFTTILHYCLVKEDDSRSKLSVFARIEYKQDHWGLIKSMIDSNVYNGLNNFYKAFLEALKSPESSSLLAANRRNIIETANINRNTYHERFAANEERRADLNNRANRNRNTSRERPIESTTRRANTVHFCHSPHTGQKLVDEILPIHLDELFNLLFSKSEFLVDFHRKQKLTDISYGNWEEKGNGQKERVISYISSSGYDKVTEMHRMNRFSKSEQHYSVNAFLCSSLNARGVSITDSSTTKLHYCLVKEDDSHSKLSVFAQIEHKEERRDWIKSRIEREVYDRLNNFYKALLEALKNYGSSSLLAANRKNIIKRKLENYLKKEYIWVLVFTLIVLLVGVWYQLYRV